MADRPFDDLMGLIQSVAAPDSAMENAALDSLARRPIAVSKNDNSVSGLLAWLAKWQGKETPTLAEVHLCLLASSYAGGTAPETIKEEMTRASQGRAAVNAMCVPSGLGLRILELAPEMPHAISPSEPAWSERDCVATIAFGMETTAAGGDMLGLAGLAPGGEAAAEALIAAFTELEPWTEAGAALSSELKSDDQLEALRAFAGREVAAMIGGMVAARSRKLPVLIEGWGSLAAYAVLKSLNSKAVDHVRLAAITDAAQNRVADVLGLKPIVGLEVVEGVGSGLALAADIMKATVGLFKLPEK